MILSDKIIQKISFDELVHDKESGTIIYYFIAPKDILEEKYILDVEVESAEIYVEVPQEIELTTDENVKAAAAQAYVMLSPTKEVDGVMTDFDWEDVFLDIETIIKLIQIYVNHNNKK